MRIKERLKRLEDSASNAGEFDWLSTPEALAAEAEAEKIVAATNNGSLDFPPETPGEELKSLLEHKPDRSYMDAEIPEAEKRCIAAADEIIDRVLRSRIAILEAELGLPPSTDDTGRSRRDESRDRVIH